VFCFFPLTAFVSGLPCLNPSIASPSTSWRRGFQSGRALVSSSLLQLLCEPSGKLSGQELHQRLKGGQERQGPSHRFRGLKTTTATLWGWVAVVASPEAAC